MKLSLNEQGWNRLFIILNGTFLVYSLVLCGLSIKVQDDLSQFNEILQRISPSIIPVIIFTGLIGIIAAITGYCKILKQNQIITILHIISLSIATVTELCIAIGTIMTPNEFYTKANSSLQNSLHYYEQHPVYTEQFNHLQENYKCCGSLLFTDYRRTNNSLPVSCKDDKFIYAVVSQFFKFG
ncbi:similar to tetraspanin TE736 [Schistosoma mansoni]|uniref:similar to tetraspanin TE736 n=1 Tax=Schistosoma mansoni TaxID=6183 RepID=UPI00022C86DF|nr:similar to tetraspanin TE736 [Schistosoma mansoni]|eukprot:XP_018645502.1 similar to tetraspanin TE736 [Schistosoma mansoni]